MAVRSPVRDSVSRTACFSCCRRRFLWQLAQNRYEWQVLIEKCAEILPACTLLPVDCVHRLPSPNFWDNTHSIHPAAGWPRSHSVTMRTLLQSSQKFWPPVSKSPTGIKRETAVGIKIKPRSCERRNTFCLIEKYIYWKRAECAALKGLAVFKVRTLTIRREEIEIFLS